MYQLRKLLARFTHVRTYGQMDIRGCEASHQESLVKCREPFVSYSQTFFCIDAEGFWAVFYSTVLECKSGSKGRLRHKRAGKKKVNVIKK